MNRLTFTWLIVILVLGILLRIGAEFYCGLRDLWNGLPGFTD